MADEKGVPPLQYGGAPPPQYQQYPPAGQVPGPVPVGAYPPVPGTAYPPPPPGYNGPPAVNVVVAAPGIGHAAHGSNHRYNQSPALILCQHCQATVTTSMEYETGLLTWAIVGGTCLMGCWLGCCFIPFCIDAAKDVTHKCPNCNNIVGKFRHFS